MQTITRAKSTGIRLLLFINTENPKACALLYALRAYFQEHTDIVALNEDYFVLIVDITGFLKERP